MIGEMIDRLVSVFAPAAAAKRVRDRTVFRQMAERSYDAAQTNRLNSNWRTANRSADAELQDAADIIRSRSRSLVRNNAYARGIIRARCRNIIGSGIRPQSRTDSLTTNEERENAWNKWQSACDLTGRLSFYEMQKLISREVDEAGECLVRFINRTPDRTQTVPLTLELIEADRIASDTYLSGKSPATGNEIRRGVELDAEGRTVAFWLYKQNPNGVNTLTQEAKRYPAAQFAHLYREERIGQTRGVSIFAPVVNWLKNLGYYVENEMQSSAIASCFTAAITTLAGAADGGLLSNAGESSDSDGNTFEYMEPGMIARLMPGEDVKTLNPSRSQSEAKVWVDLMLRSMAVGTGLSYERLSRDYSQTNYSSNRASDLEDRREFTSEQDWFVSHLCAPTWQRFFSAAVTANVPGFPGPLELIQNPDLIAAVTWQPPGWEWVDPLKEQEASAAAIGSNLSTVAEEAGKRGRDWRDVYRQRAEERRYADQLGLTDAADAGSSAAAAGSDDGTGSDGEVAAADETETENELETVGSTNG